MQGRPYEVPIVICKTYSVLCVLEQQRVNSTSALSNWEQLVQLADGRSCIDVHGLLMIACWFIETLLSP